MSAGSASPRSVGPRSRRCRVGRDRLTALAAAVAITTLALSKSAALGSVSVPAGGLTLAVAALLSRRLISLVMRALAPRRAAEG